MRLGREAPGAEVGWGASARGSLPSLGLCLLVTSEDNKLHSLPGAAVQSGDEPLLRPRPPPPGRTAPESVSVLCRPSTRTTSASESKRVRAKWQRAGCPAPRTPSSSQTWWTAASRGTRL